MRFFTIIKSNLMFVFCFVKVIELVLSGNRPSLDSIRGLIPHYKQLVQACWDPDPDLRPTFQQVGKSHGAT